MADPVDRTHLERLATRFGSHFLLQIIDLFIVQGRDRIAAAEEGIASGNAAAIIAAAHALKSSAGNLGAGPLGKCADAIERRGSAGASVDVLAPMVPSLQDAFVAACTVLEAARADVARRTA
ncbi:MAG TPA: Hpt domain-containing protein [Gemmatimonadaceae bacterium]|jgi:HPt (histidine-containing phosphotransfer) domain-containing protein